MSNTRVVCLTVQAEEGATLLPALREAMQLALKEWRDVELHHGDTVYSVKLNAMFSAALRRKEAM